MERVAEKSGFAPKRLARQLDFTELNGLTVALPFFEQLKSEPKSETESNSSPRPLLRGTIKSDSPSLQADNSTEVKDGTLEELQRCKCRQSRCVKLYCQCFATGTYCDGCSCINCQNNVGNKAVREVALASTLERNRKAFRTKIANSPNESHDYEDDTKNIMLFAKYKGCHCNKSRCLKRYCECFRAKIPCSENCKCTGCKNFEKCEERLALYNGRNAKSMAFIKQTNVAISGAIGFSGYRSSKKYMKRKYQENFPGSNRGYPLICRLTQDLQIVGSSALGFSNITYRSLLAGAIQQQDMRELCSILVVVSEASKTPAVFPDQNGSVDEQSQQTMRENQRGSFLTNRDGENCHKGPEVHKSSPNVYLGREINKNADDDTCSGDADVQKERPVSPGTHALLCEEKDILFSADASSDQIKNYGSNTDVCVEQERLVLLKFLDYLTRLITHGNTKETEVGSKPGTNAE